MKTSSYNMITISPREQEILYLIAYEYTSLMIANELYLSPHTVVSHRKNLLSKLQVKNVAGLVRKAFELDLLTINKESCGQESMRIKSSQLAVA